MEGCPAAVKKQIEDILAMPNEKIDQILKANPESLLQDDEEKVEMIVQNRLKFSGKVSEGMIVAQDEEKQFIEIEFQFDRAISIQDLDVGHSIAVFPQNTESDVNKVIKAFGWDENEYLGNYTVKELLTTQIDIRSRKVRNLNKLTNGVIPEAKDVKHQYSLLELAMSPQVLSK